MKDKTMPKIANFKEKDKSKQDIDLYYVGKRNKISPWLFIDDKFYELLLANGHRLVNEGESIAPELKQVTVLCVYKGRYNRPPFSVPTETYPLFAIFPHKPHLALTFCATANSNYEREYRDSFLNLKDMANLHADMDSAYCFCEHPKLDISKLSAEEIAALSKRERENGFDPTRTMNDYFKITSNKNRYSSRIKAEYKRNVRYFDNLPQNIKSVISNASSASTGMKS